MRNDEAVMKAGAEQERVAGGRYRIGQLRENRRRDEQKEKESALPHK
jgi:hypothetical protein